MITCLSSEAQIHTGSVGNNIGTRVISISNIKVVVVPLVQRNMSVGIVVRLVISRETARSQQGKKGRTKWEEPIRGGHPKIRRK
jgi:hypothetical protein